MVSNELLQKFTLWRIDQGWCNCPTDIVSNTESMGYMSKALNQVIDLGYALLSEDGIYLLTESGKKILGECGQKSAQESPIRSDAREKQMVW